MKKFKLFCVFIIIIAIGSYFIFTKGKGTYKIGGAHGFSKTIKESKERSTFLTELNHNVIPDSIRISNKFYLEKAFKYGEWNANDTDTIGINENFKYQLGIENYSSLDHFFKIDNYWFQGNIRFNSIPDTIKFDIYKSGPFNDDNKIGILILTK